MVALLLVSSNIFAQGKGLYQSFETLIDLQKINYQKKLEKLSTKSTTLRNLADVNQVDLDPDFINTVLFYSPSRYASLAHKDKCSFYDLYLAGHIKGPNGPLSKFIIRYKDKKGESKTGVVTPKIFLEKIAYVQCPQSKKFFQYFQLKNLKNTLKTVYLKPPSSYDQCYKLHDEFTNDYKTPYLCKIYESVDSINELNKLIKNMSKSNYRKVEKLKKQLTVAKRYKKLLNESSYDFLKNLCENIEKPKRFCHDFFNASFWKKVIKGEKDEAYIKNKCLALMGKKKLNRRRLKKCVRELTDNKDLCYYLNKYDQSLAPRQNCEMQSFALNQSRLFSSYVDCPSRVGHEGITNVARVVKHIDPESKSIPGTSCELDTINEYVKFNHEASDGRFWGLKLCYDDKINQEEVCLATLTGDIADSEYSIGKVVAKILFKTRGYNEEKGCKLIDQKEYKPTLLMFKTGCFIITDKKQCYGTDCKFKVILDEREIDFITFKNEMLFDYFPSSFLEENLAQTKLIERHYQKKVRRIVNVSFLKSMFKEHPKSIIQGIACAEDMLPTFFSKNILHRCTPLPFIVDGLISDKGYTSLIVRTAMDSISSPRIISWSYIFSALKAYKDLHPLELWGLYAIY